MSNQPEPWLRGTHTDLPAVLRAVIHALELARENIESSCATLSEEAINARPGGIAPLAFHLRHIVRSLDRLLTYAEGRELTAGQIASLKSELDKAVPSDVLAEFRAGMDQAVARIRAFAQSDLEEARAVGRKAFPTTVGGLLVHCADHTQRHTGQAVTTVKVLAATIPEKV